MYQRSFSLLSPESSLLFVVDVQERLLPNMLDADEVVFNVRRLLQGAAVTGVPAMLSQQYPKGLGPTLPEVLHALPPGTPVFDKKAFSICAVDEIRRELDRHETGKIVLCGVESHICVLQSAFDLMTLGWEVVVAADAVASRFPRDRRFALRRMESAGVTLTTVESILFEWCATAEHPGFKAVSALAKEV